VVANIRKLFPLVGPLLTVIETGRVCPSAIRIPSSALDFSFPVYGCLTPRMRRRRTCPSGMSVENTRAEICQILIERQLPSGGWPALAPSPQTALEATAYSMLALGPEHEDEYGRALRCVLDCQNPNGSWPSFIGDDPEGAWTTALVLIALAENFKDVRRRHKGFQWLLQSAGKESSWLWRWKFRTTDRQVRFDSRKFGWPWQPDTNSWVVPTAFAILALDHLPPSWAKEHSGFRLQRGTEMLLDRVCPGGGWNAGNGVVYGTALAPHPDDTAVALLALKNRADESVAVGRSLEWLMDSALRISAPWSLAWSALALAAYGRCLNRLLSSLAEQVRAIDIPDTATLAVVALALDSERSLRLLRVKL